jgi:hypothetical protein
MMAMSDHDVQELLRQLDDQELEIIALRFERDTLLAQRDATRAFLGDLLNGSPLDDSKKLTEYELAVQCVEAYPLQPITAIKELRSRSRGKFGTQLSGDSGERHFSLKEAKDLVDKVRADRRAAGVAI